MIGSHGACPVVGHFAKTGIYGADTASIDSFSRLRTSNPAFVFDSQFTFDLQPLLFERIVTGTVAMNWIELR